MMVSDNGWVTLLEMKMLWAFADTAELEAALSLLSAFRKENTRYSLWETSIVALQLEVSSAVTTSLCEGVSRNRITEH